ncbi:hypothetical protein AKJ40_04510 [candidate division MSBL1 archaeon SCGC-AAA259M10]|uniref:C_GCAxxG_C_C family protein n=1 Tax=candidate division MSBL1 archaeon SCGC-AAA259M10 TaxID=1698270 RepID=A0A133UX19_9EURY|nr:hypothetical protein AKJ40_04510 [candidate division MSBL1 archaeon SCGC-AAA259M10]
MNKKMLEKAYELGFEFEKNYHGCAQCVIGAIYELFPEMKERKVFQSASGLAAGIGLSTEGHCGALSAGVMILSQKFGRTLRKIEDSEERRFKAYRLSEKLVEKFLGVYSSVKCKEIQKKLMGRSFYLFDPDDWEAFEKIGGHKKVCPDVVGKATKWTVEILLNEKENKD